MREWESANLEKTAMMPPADVMEKELGATRLPLRHQGVLHRFVHSIADQKESGSTLVAAWESACEEANRTFPLRVNEAITRLLHLYSFSSVVDAITPDETVARQAKEDLKFLEEIRL